METVKKCTGCGTLSTKELGLNSNGEKYLACCPDNNYKPITAVEWLEIQTRKPDWHSLKRGDMFEQAKELEINQLIDAHCDGQSIKDTSGIPDAENYYNQTYK